MSKHLVASIQSTQLQIQSELTLLSGSLVLFPLPGWALGIVHKQETSCWTYTHAYQSSD